MILRHKADTISYHRVPPGWYAHEIIAQHRQMRGAFSIEGPDATEPGAPSWMPERQQWLQYRETLYRVADGLRADDEACVELAVRYIELHYIGSYSGYIRDKLARRLIGASRSSRQNERLSKHFLKLVLGSDFVPEFRMYRKLWAKIITPKELKQLQAFMADNPAKFHQKWLAELSAKVATRES
jgi:cytochrome P450